MCVGVCVCVCTCVCVVSSDFVAIWTIPRLIGVLWVDLGLFVWRSGLVLWVTKSSDAHQDHEPLHLDSDSYHLHLPQGVTTLAYFHALRKF